MALEQLSCQLADARDLWELGSTEIKLHYRWSFVVPLECYIRDIPEDRNVTVVLVWVLFWVMFDCVICLLTNASPTHRRKEFSLRITSVRTRHPKTAALKPHMQISFNVGKLAATETLADWVGMPWEVTYFVSSCAECIFLKNLKLLLLLRYLTIALDFPLCHPLVRPFIYPVAIFVIWVNPPNYSLGFVYLRGPMWASASTFPGSHQLLVCKVVGFLPCKAYNWQLEIGLAV